MSGSQLYRLLSNDPHLITTEGDDGRTVPFPVPSTEAQAITTDSAIQPASLDLSVGDIYLPGKGRLRRRVFGGKPVKRYDLAPGQTVVVETLERLHLPRNIAAFGFPPARVSSRGLLMTNPGHVDPGYHGRLHFTVINMGRKEFSLERGARIATLLFCELQSPTVRDWGVLNPKGAAPVSDRTLAELSPDFLEVERRARRVAWLTILKRDALLLGAPLIIALIALLVPIVQDRGKLQDLRDRVTRLEAEVTSEPLRHTVDSLKIELDSTKAHMKP